MQHVRKKGNLNRMGVSQIRRGHAAFLAAVLFATSGFAQKDAPKGTDFESLKARAEKGDAVAQTALGMMYCYGQCVTPNLTEGHRLLQEAAAKGVVSAQYALAEMYERGECGKQKDLAEALKWFHKAAEQGDPTAQCKLGEIYFSGDRTPKDPTEGVKWFRKAAEQGDPEGQYNLGGLFADGQGVTKDEKEAVSWFRKAAEQGHSIAQMTLGEMYAKGAGVTKSNAEVYRWSFLSMSTELGREEAEKRGQKMASSMTAEEVAEGKRLVAAFAPHKKAADQAGPAAEIEQMLAKMQKGYDEVLKKLNTIKILKAQFDDTPIEEVLAFIIKEGRAADPKHESVPIRIEPDPTLSKVHISMNFTEPTMCNALGFASQLAWLKFEISPDGVLIYSPRSPDRLKAATAVQKPAVNPEDSRLKLEPGQVAVEYLAHACFRIQSSKGTRLVIDPYESNAWLGYALPSDLSADAVLISHPHYDHDAGHSDFKPFPWGLEIPVLFTHGNHTIGDIQIHGIRGKHAGNYGKDFGDMNTIWLLETGGLRIAHVGDNGPLSEANIKELGRVDVLMLPIDSQNHILGDAEIEAIRAAVHPRVLIPMHYRIPDLEIIAGQPAGLGEIEPWAAKQKEVVHLDSNIHVFTKENLPKTDQIFIFPHSPKIHRAHPKSK